MKNKEIFLLIKDVGFNPHFEPPNVQLAYSHEEAKNLMLSEAVTKMVDFGYIQAEQAERFLETGVQNSDYEYVADGESYTCLINHSQAKVEGKDNTYYWSVIKSTYMPASNWLVISYGYKRLRLWLKNGNKKSNCPGCKYPCDIESETECWIFPNKPFCESGRCYMIPYLTRIIADGKIKKEEASNAILEHHVRETNEREKALYEAIGKSLEQTGLDEHNASQITEELFETVMKVVETIGEQPNFSPTLLQMWGQSIRATYRAIKHKLKTLRTGE